MLTEKDMREIETRGMSREAVLAQVETFKKGFPYVDLVRPCTLGDGIRQLNPDDAAKFEHSWLKACRAGRMMKFVPASGAASRMFKALNAFYGPDNSNADLNPDRLRERVAAGAGDEDAGELVQFITNIRRFAFYDELKTVMSKKGLDLDPLVERGIYGPVLEAVLDRDGLNYRELPKGLVPFHRYPDHIRTAFEEHLAEAVAYVTDGSGVARIHFTVAPEFSDQIKRHLAQEKIRHERAAGARLEITFSVQKPSTDTLAVDLDNRPFRASDGRLVFRPAGHGALIENLNDLQGDIVFIKNIDNVVSDPLKEMIYRHKKILAGFLLELESKIAEFLDGLSHGRAENAFLDRVLEFLRHDVGAPIREEMTSAHASRKREYLAACLNRPLRVCGMVRNQGELGGGPFWVRHSRGEVSAQIVESSQVDLRSERQKEIWQSATHFNPVDLVCLVRDFKGRPYDLRRFVDPDTGIISIKSRDGRNLKALELPGLWDGGMAAWNTVFVEVPLATFYPVKTVTDLLRKEHQPV